MYCIQEYLSSYLSKYDKEEIPFKADSRRVKPGDIFFAVKGSGKDGHEYIGEVLAKGARAVVCEYIPEDLDSGYSDRINTVNDVRSLFGEAVSLFYNDPSSRLEVFGITGTNGKTTTVFLIDQILTSAGKDAGFISTVFTKVRGTEFMRSSMTTPDVSSVYKSLSDMISSGKTSAVVEVSSHALSQRRLWGIGLDSAIFTNITPEHLDYHLTMESYLADKLKIFDLLKPGGVAVVNADDARVHESALKLNAVKVVTFGLDSPADIAAQNIKMTSTSTEFDIAFEGEKTIRITSSLIGRHNVSNMLAASAAAYSRGIAPEVIAKALSEAIPVPGRLELVSPEGGSFSVFVDYAHTPDALNNILECLKPLTKGRLVSVFGCGGDRDRSKRSVMGAIGSKFSSEVILTNDNPRTEDPRSILREIEGGIAKGYSYRVIPDREEAISTAINEASTGDVVLVAGKGHEDYQIIGDRKIHFDDKEVIRKVFADGNKC